MFDCDVVLGFIDVDCIDFVWFECVGVEGWCDGGDFYFVVGSDVVGC